MAHLDMCMPRPLHQVKYHEKFDKEMKGKKPKYDLKDSKIYQTLKDATNLASEVRLGGRSRSNAFISRVLLL